MWGPRKHASDFDQELVAMFGKYVHGIIEYPGTQHGFNNDTTPRYDQAAAKLASGRTVGFFKKNLR
jgi:carboxymethylenebutenolidase